MNSEPSRSTASTPDGHLDSFCCIVCDSVQLHARADRCLRPVQMSLEKSLQLRADQCAGGTSSDYFGRAGSFGDILQVGEISACKASMPRIAKSHRKCFGFAAKFNEGGIKRFRWNIDTQPPPLRANPIARCAPQESCVICLHSLPPTD